MAISEKSRRLRKDFLMAVAVLALIVAIEAGFLQLVRVLPPGPIFQTFEDKKIAIQSNENYDVLFFGDSTALHGLVPSFFSQETGLRSYNFATYAPSAGFGNLFLLREYLQTREPPKQIVMVLSVRYLTEKPSLPMFREYFFAPDLAAVLHDVDPSYWYDPRRLLEKILPSYCNRERILTGLKLWWKGEESPVPERGYLRNDNRLVDASERLHEIAGLGDQESTEIWEPNITFLKMFCELAGEHSVPTYVKIGPVAQSAYADTDLVQYMAKSVQYLQQTVATYSHCTVDPQISFYRDDVMGDLTHVNHTGALVLTQTIIDAMRE